MHAAIRNKAFLDTFEREGKPARFTVYLWSMLFNANYPRMFPRGQHVHEVTDCRVHATKRKRQHLTLRSRVGCGFWNGPLFH